MTRQSPQKKRRKRPSTFPYYEGGESELPGKQSRRRRRPDPDASYTSEGDTDSTCKRGKRKEFQPFIRDMPLWGEALFLTAACLAAYFLFVQADIMFPPSGPKTEVYHALFHLIVLIVLPGATVAYLVRRWLSGK